MAFDGRAVVFYLRRGGVVVLDGRAADRFGEAVALDGLEVRALKRTGGVPSVVVGEGGDSSSVSERRACRVTTWIAFFLPLDIRFFLRHSIEVGRAAMSDGLPLFLISVGWTWSDHVPTFHFRCRFFKTIADTSLQELSDGPKPVVDFI